jgi:hypothetical protein
MIFRRFYTFTSILILIISTISFAQKTDVITLINTDRITGDLKSMRSGLLQLSTDNMGTINIEWDKVKEIRTDKFYQIELDDGRIYFGSLQPSDKKDMVLVKGVTMDKRLYFTHIVEITRIKETFWEILGGYIQLGVSYNKGSEVAELNFDADLTYYTKKRQLELILNSVISSTSDTSATKNQNASLSFLRYLERKWFWAALIGINQNTTLGLDLRANIGGSIGNDFIHTNHMLLSSQIGLIGNREWYTNQTDPQNNLTLVLTCRYKYFIYESPGITLDSYLYVYPYITEIGRIRITYNLSLDWEIINDFYWNMTFNLNSDNKPQSQVETKVDYNINTGLKYSL